jgi:glycine oxidase
MADAIVIGGGVMGLAASRELRRRGYTVTLLERAQPGRGASWASAGIIGATLRDESDPSYHLRRVSRELWPAFADALHSESGMDPEYREMGCIQLASDGDELTALEHAARRQRGSATTNEQPNREPAPELLDPKQLRELEPALSAKLAGGLLVSGGNVDNRRLCKALEIAARRAGVQIETGVEVVSIATTGGKVSGVELSPRSAPTTHRGEGGGSGEHDHEGSSTHRGVGGGSGSSTVTGSSEFHHGADLVVLAAGAWSANIAHLRPVPPVAPQRGQILALDQSSVGVRHVLLTPGDPYFVPRADGRLVIGATREEAGWDPSLTAGGIAWLLNRAMDVVPALHDCPIAEMWTGFRPASADGLPLIGKGGYDGLYFLTGHGPSGIAPLPGSVALLMALIHNEPPPMPADAFSPRRFENNGQAA